MTSNFNSEISNANSNSLEYYIDDDGAFKFISPYISSSNFDGSILIVEDNVVASLLQPGWLVKIDSNYLPIVSISYDDSVLEGVPSSNIMTVTYMNTNNEAQTIDYGFSDLVDVRYEDWSNKNIGSQGWMITSGGNAIFANVGVRGEIEATTMDIGGDTGIVYDGNTVTIGASVVINAPITFNGVTEETLSASLTGYVMDGQLTDNTTIISGGNIQTGTISAITFQTNLSGRRSKLGAGDAYVPTNWSTTVVPRNGGGGSTSYLTTGLEFFDQNNARTGYMYSADKYVSGVFQPGSKLLVIGSTDSNGLDTGTEILLSDLNIDIYAANIIDIESTNGVRLYGSSGTGLKVGPFGSNEVYVDGLKINFSQDWKNTYGSTPSAQFYSNIYAMNGYKFFGDGSGLTNLPAPANVVLTTGAYANPSWITSLAGSKISGNISGNANNITAWNVNQNVGTGNSPTFSGITVNGPAFSSGTGSIYDANVTGTIRDVYVSSTGRIGYNAASSFRIKKNIIPIIAEDNFISSVAASVNIYSRDNLIINYKDILNLTPVQFEWNDEFLEEGAENCIEYGFIAEEVKEIFPPAFLDEKIPGYHSRMFMPILFAIIKDQQKIIDNLQDRMIQLESQLGG